MKQIKVLKMYQQQLCQIVIIHCTRECHSTLFDHVLSEHPVLESVMPDYVENDDGWEYDNSFLAHSLRLWNEWALNSLKYCQVFPHTIQLNCCSS